MSDISILRDILRGWIGLNSLLPNIDDDTNFYRYNCNNTICEKPDTIDKLIQVLHTSGINEIDDDMYQKIKENYHSGNMYNSNNLGSTYLTDLLDILNNYTAHNPKIDSSKCRVYKTSYVPIDCIKAYITGNPVKNNIDGNDYIIRNISFTPINGTHKAMIFESVNNKMIFSIFGFGKVPTSDELYHNVRVGKRYMYLYIQNNLKEYLLSDFIVVLCGHSNGIDNAFLISNILMECVYESEKVTSSIDEIVSEMKIEVEKTMNMMKQTRDNYLEDLNYEINEYKSKIKYLTISINNYIDKLKQNKYNSFISKYIDDIQTTSSSTDKINSYHKDTRDAFVHLRTNQNNQANIKIPTTSRISIEIYSILKENNVPIEEIKQIFEWLSELTLNLDERINLENTLSKDYNDDQIQKIKDDENTYIELIRNNYTNEINSLTDFKDTIKRFNIESLRNNIYIMGSGGYPCFGNNLIDYLKLKEFYKHKILHFRLPGDRTLEANLDILAYIYRSDLIEVKNIMNDNNVNHVTIIYHDVENLLSDQKKGNFDSTRMNAIEIKRFHEWSKYRPILEKMIHNENIINALNKIISNTESNTKIGGYHNNFQRYVEAKYYYIKLLN